MLPGSDVNNSYTLRVTRNIELAGAAKDRSDLEPLAEYLRAEGWQVEIRERGEERYDLWADSGEGWWVNYLLQPAGHFTLGVSSEAFWTNDNRAFMRAISSRAPFDFPEESLPGEYQEFPSWSDPVRAR